MVKSINFLFVSLLICSINASCQKEKYPVDISGLTYRGLFVFKNQIKMQGYYHNASITNTFSYMYFFKDGTFCSSSRALWVDEVTCIKIDEIRNIPYYWGCYIIDNDTIKIQKINSHRQVFQKFKVEEKWAKTVNDSTIHFFNYISPNKQETKLSQTYYFKYCIEKPDSTNVLMKNMGLREDRKLLQKPDE